MADDWQSLTDLAGPPADADEVLVKDASDTTDDAVGTVKRNSYLNLLGTVLNALRTAFTPASAAGPASLALAEDTDNGSNTVSIAAPALVASNKTATLQDVTGTLYVSGGTDVPVADGGTGVSTLPSDELVVGAGTSPVTSTAIPAGGLAGVTALALKANAANPVFTGTVTVPDGALAIADTNGLQTALDAKAPLASPTFTTALTAANPTFTGTVTIPDGALAIADTSGLQTALDGKQPIDADLTTLATAFVSASSAGAASLALAEDTDSGSNTVSIAAPGTVASNKVATLQDVTGTLYVSGGTAVPVADGGTGVSTLGSGNVLLGAGTSPVTSAKAAPSGDFVGTTDTQTLTGKTLGAATLSGALTGADQVVSAIELKDLAETRPSATTSGAISRAFSDGGVHDITLNGNASSLAITSPPASGKAGVITFIIRQDGTGGRSWAHPSGIKWAGGVAPTLSTGINDFSVVSYMTVDAGTTWYGFTGGIDFA